MLDAVEAAVVRKKRKADAMQKKARAQAKKMVEVDVLYKPLWLKAGVLSMEKLRHTVTQRSRCARSCRNNSKVGSYYATTCTTPYLTRRNFA
jgi:hypothetical protein